MLLNLKGEQINENDLQSLEEMIAGSLQEHIERLKKYRDDELVDAPGFYAPIINVYQEGLAYLQIQLKDAAKREEGINTADFIHDFYKNLGKDVMIAVDKQSPEMITFEHNIAIGLGEENIIRGTYNEAPDPKDTVEGYEHTASAFHFSGQKLDGIETIVDYDPDKDRVKGLYQGRTANSTTLSRDPQKLREELEALPDDDAHSVRREQIQKQIEGYENGTYGLNVGAEVARMHSSELRDKDKISFSDVYKAYTEINKAMRPGDVAGGKLRGEGVSAGQIQGVGASVVPEAVYKTMQTIADGMNEIKHTQDPAMKKSMAIELAAFAYQMTLSEHSFKDGNGRTCRLFADTILQTFGLPPYTPSKEEATILKINTMGMDMDFTKGAEVFLDGVKQSSNVLAAERELQANDGVISQAGEITERVRTQFGSFKAAEEAPAPDAVSKQGEYMAFKSMQRSEKRKLEAVKDALKQAPVTDEQWDKAYFAVMGKMTGKKNLPEDEKLVDFAQALDKRMTPEQKKAVTDAMDSYKDVTEMSEEEKVDYKYQDKVQELKQSIPADISANQDMKAQYEYSLDYAAKYLNEVTDDQNMECALEANIKESVRPQYENGKYTELISEDPGTRMPRINEGKEEFFNEIANNGITFSDKTKKGIRLIVNKMEEMGLHAYDYAANGEDGAKIFSFNKIIVDRNNLEEAIKSGDPGRIMSAQIVYEKTHKDYEEIYKIAKEHFDQKPGIFPGNMDSIRNKAVPFEFAGDMKTAAEVNTVFQAFIAMKTGGITLDEYLENPVSGLIKGSLKKLEPVSFQKMTQGLNITDTVDLFTGAGEFEMSAEDYQRAVPSYLIARQLVAPNMLETDPELRKKNDVIANCIKEDVFSKAILDNQTARFRYFNNDKNDPEGNRHRMQTLKNIMLIKDEDRNLNALFDGEPERDLMGRKIGEPFNAAEYMNRKPVDYEGIMDRAGKMIKRCDQSSQFATTWYVKDNRMRQAAAELYMEVLLAHPEDAAKPEYRKMQEQMNRVYDEITEYAYEETRDIAKARKEAAAEMLEENRLNYRKTHEPVEYLRELETEAVQTGNFRKFALALSETELAIPSMTREAKLAYGEYQWTLVTAEKGADFYNNLFYEVSLLNMEESARFSHDAEELARSIRQGKTVVDPAYADIKTDYLASTIIANDMIKDNESSKIISGSQNIKMFLMQNSLRYEDGTELFIDQLNKANKDFLKDGKILPNLAQRERFLKDSNDGVKTSLYSDYGSVVDGNGVPTPPDPAMVMSRLEKSAQRTMTYYATFEEYRFRAWENLRKMDREMGGAKGSDEYKAMYQALKDVSEMGYEDSPSSVQRKLATLRDAAHDYKDKKDHQTFANILGQGKARYDLAGELETLADANYNTLLNMSQGELSMTERIRVQVDRANENYANYQLKQAALQAQQNVPVQNANAPVQNANAPVQNANAPVQNAPVQNANAPVQNANALDQHRKIDVKDLKGAFKDEKKEDTHKKLQERRSLKPEPKNGPKKEPDAPIRRSNTGV